ncbi:MAG: hypothetical protein HC790_01415 [Acaryochloridaceae cyanobacterium CSU_3_4]|nr:hypothetical protein [Acaryochloridaceae cyanobacterium CSU_3_4]
MKKSWTSPTLTTHGAIEELTQANLDQLQQMGSFTLPDQAFDLLASLGGLS